jgi:Domain of unknown function (DUF4224)
MVEESSKVFLTTEQLQELTGLRQHAAQRRWLARQGVAFRTRVDGRPVVLESELVKAPESPSRPRFDRVKPAE